jgi:hypothetical protein
MGAGNRIARATLAVVAVLLIAWFAVLFRDHRIGGAAARALFEVPATASERERALDRLEDAELLAPGNKWQTIRAGYLLRHDNEAARELAERIVEAEPDNYSAWLVLMVATRGHDERRSTQALAEMRRLNPPPGR